MARLKAIVKNGRPVNESQKEKYLGDFLTKNANPKDTIINRKQRGHGILAKMRAILSEVPLGSQRLEIGLTLRQAWFINGTLFNSEVWCAFSESDLKVLEVLDRNILRLILGAHAKTPKEILYLETSALEIRHIIAIRRLSYLQTILKRHDEEIIFQVYKAQRKSPCKGDWVLLVKEDQTKYGVDNTCLSFFFLS